MLFQPNYWKVAMPKLTCRPGCAACCIAPSISSPIPPDPESGAAGLPEGKPAGIPCPRLDAELRCTLFARPQRPSVCRSLSPEPLMCGRSREEALEWLAAVEAATLT